MNTSVHEAPPEAIMTTHALQRLTVKVGLLVALLSFATFLGLFLANTHWQDKAAMTQMRASSERASALLRMAIKKPMAMGDDTGTHAQFQTLSASFPDIRAYLTNGDGVVTYATEALATHKHLESVTSQDPEFTALFKHSLKEAVEQGMILTRTAGTAFAEVFSVPNAPECHHCHGPGRKILGSLVMLQDVSPQIATLRQTQINNALISVLGLAILLGLLFFFMRRSVIKRIRILVTGADAVRRGDLDVTFRVRGHDELASLGQSLNGMVRDLKARMEETREASALATKEAERAHKAMEEAEETRASVRRLAEYQGQEVQRLTAVLTRLADGDLMATYSVSPPTAETAVVQSNFAQIQAALNKTVDILRILLGRVGANAALLASASTELTGLSTLLTGHADTVSQGTSGMVEAGDHISRSITSMAAAAEEISVNVSAVSSTTGEMSQAMLSVSRNLEQMQRAIADIADNASVGASVAAEAMEGASQATRTMSKLGDAAKDIGKVTTVIKRIAEQTNLLALNATIEAASAGDAGRGFAVVANEIKELASQSGKAAEDIVNKITGVQRNTTEAVEIINRVAEIINRINEYVIHISAAVQQQSASTMEITANVSSTSHGARDIAISIAELAKGANDMSQSADTVAKAAQATAGSLSGLGRSAEASSQSARHVKSLAETLAQASTELQDLVRGFVTSQEIS